MRKAKPLSMVGAGTLVTGMLVFGTAQGAAASESCATNGGVTVCTFTFSGAEQVFTVPSSVTSVGVLAIGGDGQGTGGTGTGGRGEIVSTVIPTTPGQSLFVEVGGSGAASGAFNGGGPGGSGANAGGGGGGASDVRSTRRSAGDATSLPSRLVVAGGGGGAGGDTGCPFPDLGSPIHRDGGPGGDADAGGAASASCPGGTGGASGDAGGQAGSAGPPAVPNNFGDQADGTDGDNGLAGAGGGGGAGGVGGCGTGGGGGGGGAGYVGGGGGGGGAGLTTLPDGCGAFTGGGGGGGSSYVASSATNTSMSVNSGNAAPQVRIRYLAPGTPLTCSVSLDMPFTVALPSVRYGVQNPSIACTDASARAYNGTVTSGSGHSKGLGPGTGCPTATTQNFTLGLAVRLTSASPTAQTQDLSLSLPVLLSAPGVDSLPGTQNVSTTTFGVSGTGSGTLSYRVGHRCSGGSNAARFDGTIPV
jgi:hypothetical protein